MSFDPELVLLDDERRPSLSGPALLEQAAALVGPRLSPMDWNAFDAGLLPEWAPALVRRELGPGMPNGALFLALAGWRASSQGSLD